MIYLALFLIVFEMIPEGLALAGHKGIAGMFEFIFLAGVTLGLFAMLAGQYQFKKRDKFYELILGYVFLRFAIADIIFNLCAGLPIFYIGSTKWYDQAWQWFFELTRFPEEPFLSTIKLIIGLIGLTFLLKKPKYVL